MDRTSVHEHSKVLSADGIERSLRRISHEILERNASNLGGLALVGVLTRGVLWHAAFRRTSGSSRGSTCRWVRWTLRCTATTWLVRSRR